MRGYVLRGWCRTSAQAFGAAEVALRTDLMQNEPCVNRRSACVATLSAHWKTVCRWIVRWLAATASHLWKARDSPGPVFSVSPVRSWRAERPCCHAEWRMKYVLHLRIRSDTDRGSHSGRPVARESCTCDEQEVA